MAEHTAERLQELADRDGHTGVERDVLAELDEERHLSLAELDDRLDAPRPAVEDAIRRLLERHEVGETADWQFYRAARVDG